MTEVYWLLGTLLLALGYDDRAGAEIQRGVKWKIGLKNGLVITAVFIAVSLILYAVKLPGYVLVVGGALLTQWAAWLGLRYWDKDPDWQNIGSRMIVGFLMVFLWLKMGPFVCNNILVALIGAGLGCYFGHRLTKGFAYLFYTLLIFMDAYAVWYSNIMSTLIDKYTNVVPVGVVSLVSGSYLLGTGDFIFATIGCITIKTHTNWRWAVAAALGYAASFAVMDATWFTRILPRNFMELYLMFPAMVTICPITMLFLWLGSRPAPGPRILSIKQ